MSYNHPWKVSCSVFFLTIVLTGIVGGASLFAITPENGKSWFPLMAEETRRMDALEKAIEATSGSFSPPERSLNNFQYAMYFVYKASNGNMLTPANLQVVSDTEEVLLKTKLQVKDGPEKTYMGDFCQLEYTGGSTKCTSPISWRTTLQRFLPTPNSTLDQAVVTQAVNDVQDSPRRNNLLTSAFSLENQKSEYTRSIYAFGSPTKGFASTTEEEGEQREDVLEFQEKVAEKFVDLFDLKATWVLDSKFKDKALRKTDDGEVEIVFSSSILIDAEIERIVGGDFLWAFFCIIAVWIYMAIHTQSLLLATVGMYEIVMAFPVAFFFYRCLFQVSYFQNLQILAVFVMLGIGADDVFVFVDAFKQSRNLPELSTCERVIYAADRASKAIFATSLTTAGAFAATTTSSVMPIAAFGIFASTLIIVLFLLNIALLPPVLVLYERNFGALPCCVCTKSCLDGPMCGCCHGDGSCKSCYTPEPAEGESPKSSERKIEAFFHGPFSKVVIYSPARYGFMVVFLVIFIVGLIFALDLRPPKEQTTWFPPEHMYTKSNTWQDENFGDSSTDMNAQVTLTWGIKGVTRKGLDWWDPEARGNVIYDDTFNPTLPEVQQHLLSFCNALRVRDCDAELCKKTGNTLVRNNEVLCVMEGFEAWLKTNGESYPIDDKSDFLRKLLEYSSRNETQSTYGDMVGFVKQEADCETCVTEEGVTYRLRHLVMKANTSFAMPQPFSLALPCQEQWEEFMDEQNDAAPRGGGGALQMSYVWVWAKTQEALVDLVVNGMGITFTLSFVVLVFATGNVVLALISIATIAGIVVSVLGIGCRGMMGWDLDITESIAAVILIGFSVDYCVHLAHAYVESACESRQERIQDALTTMGISVTAGAATTFMAGIFLFGAVLPFFQKYGFILLFTIFSSYLWAVVFFCSACSLLGPQGTVGELAVMWKWAKQSIHGAMKGGH
jgi:predicted RND superfamily exporter protein